MGGEANPVIGATYRHRKGGEYVVVAVAEHTETEESIVVYRRLADGKVYVRPLEMFADGRFELAQTEWGATVDLEGILARAQRGDTAPSDAVLLVKFLMVAECQRDDARTNLAEASRVWDGPETGDWLESVRKEAAHQVARWGAAHDEGKTHEEWLWLVGWLVSKAVHAANAGDLDKALHHTVSSGAALLNWHARLTGLGSQMRPGIDASGDFPHDD